MASLGSKILNLIMPKSGKAGGTASTGTFDPSVRTGLISTPQYRDHLTDIFSSRLSDDSRTLISQLAKLDPDVSAAFSSYLTLANTEPVIVARDLEEAIDRDATKQVYQLIRALTQHTDYSLGFQLKPSLNAISENLRYMLLASGSCMSEAVLDKKNSPSEIRLTDPMSIEWVEKTPGEYKPQQKIKGQNKPVSLDLPGFFVNFYRRDPTKIYTYSPFVSVINTVAARQQVINSLYRILQKTGFPRMSLKLVEEVMMKAIPANIKLNADESRKWMNLQMGEIAAGFSNLRPDQVYVHWDSIEPGVLNAETPGVEVDMTSVISTLDAQNQAALKTMATVIGRGTAGVNTASVESRLAAMNADELNEPVADHLSDIFTFLMNLQGFQGFVDVTFRKAEMRPDTELEPQLVMKQSRLQTDLSLGLISDDEYHLEMYGRIRPDFAPELSGTGFMQPTAVSVDAQNVTPNSDPLGRSLVSPDSKVAKSKQIKTRKKN